MSAAVVILPMVWATAAGPRKTGWQRQAENEEREAALVEARMEKERQPDPSLAFYRKYTEGLLRRYVRMAMGAGRVPSLLGRELFRGRVSNYHVEGFDDVVIFVQDVESCVAMLDRGHQLLIERIAMQEYTREEAAALMRLPLRTIERSYPEALDLLTELFLEKRLLDPQKSCQEG